MDQNAPSLTVFFHTKLCAVSLSCMEVNIYLTIRPFQRLCELYFLDQQHFPYMGAASLFAVTVSLQARSAAISAQLLWRARLLSPLFHRASLPPACPSAAGARLAYVAEITEGRFKAASLIHRRTARAVRADVRDRLPIAVMRNVIARSEQHS